MKMTSFDMILKIVYDQPSNDGRLFDWVENKLSFELIYDFL